MLYVPVVPTDSPSGTCLVTPNESPTAAFAGTTVYCGARNYQGVDGIVLTVFLPEPAPSDLMIEMTVYQESAHRYGRPIFYAGTPNPSYLDFDVSEHWNVQRRAFLDLDALAGRS
jgi:hypothetical protein